MMNAQKAESIGDFIKNALKDSSHTVIPNVSAAKGIWHAVTHFNGIFYLFFGIDDRPGVNLLTSSDGYVFEEHENNPVLSTGKKGAWDDLYIELHSILRVAKRWRIVYGDYTKNPVLSPNTMSYDCKRIVWPYAVQVDEELYLYYQIVDSKGKWKLVVTSINLKI